MSSPWNLLGRVLSSTRVGRGHLRATKVHCSCVPCRHARDLRSASTCGHVAAADWMGVC